MKPTSLTRSWPVRQVRVRTAGKTVADTLAVEEPLELRVRGRSVAVVMRTPGHDADLAAGFLLTEGVVHSADDLYDIMQCRTTDVRANAGNVVEAVLAKKVRVDFDRLTRHVFSGSSCGLCGKATIAAVQQQFPRIRRPLRVAAGILRRLPAQLAAAQPAFKTTGGLHATALFDATGTLLVAREDVGRHNAMDKVLGHALRTGWLPLDRHILLVSGRVSFEIMQKALAAGISVVAGISAPTSLAAEFARANRQTLVGFLRADRMNVYAGQLARIEMKIAALYVSPGHNYFGRHGLAPGEHSVVSVPAVECLAGRGLAGDRFVDYKEDYAGQVTFFAVEVFEEIRRALGGADRAPAVFRRNILTRGADLNALIGVEFELQGVRFAGVRECSPCYWMDQAFAPGAEAWLKGRGGLRARILTSGWLKVDDPLPC